MLAMETSLRVGMRSREVFEEEPSLRASSWRSAGDGAKARIDRLEKRESDERREDEPLAVPSDEG